ncbi:hypothetical protein K437DRAFT_47714 [Tilletiaria anomala UBC 951]|uniref:Uncharacterized protein n=1 Tax=Tilletiaria anomala (strain ATCC 24038 / CBS 436.72 / UBC 951) TaxID=1037660 RepID=A0A066V5C2_TILAU|nr:uncharacterized protein K437DRAFT_47714 [Tilletiaria anomala UBC 951]KDN36927.1 hypothetical protein K437DRAFT_47714 [Tilletiaria anomala UBC 951]
MSCSWEWSFARTAADASDVSSLRNNLLFHSPTTSLHKMTFTAFCSLPLETILLTCLLHTVCRKGTQRRALLEHQFDPTKWQPAFTDRGCRDRLNIQLCARSRLVAYEWGGELYVIANAACRLSITTSGLIRYAECGWGAVSFERPPVKSLRTITDLILRTARRR